MRMVNEYAELERIYQELMAVQQRDAKRHLMDQHLTPSMHSLLEDEILPLLEAEINYDPTPQTAYDFFH